MQDKSKSRISKLVDAVKEMVPMQWGDEYADYQKTRRRTDRKLLCKAPFNSMYFNVYGQCAPCWLTLTEADTYPEKSIREIWFGEKFNALRKAIQAKDLDYKCQTCKKNIQQGNHVSVLSKLYDYPHALGEYPTVMEFELSNRCNLECVMCKGDLSSTIRKNRDQLDPLPIRYDDQFVKQLEEFIPHLEEVKFLGGEPFLIDIYYNIWEKIADIKPSIKITITTNGSVFNQRVQKLLERLDCNIILSLDSTHKETYEKIRIHGNLNKVLENFEHFRKYTTKRNNYLGVSVNPLRKNWQEIPDYVHFCNEKGASIWFNTVIYPHEEALWTLPAMELQHIYETLSKIHIAQNPSYDMAWQNGNIKKYINLVEVQIYQWWQEAKAREDQKKKISLQSNDVDIEMNLRADLEHYIYSDAYISPNQKEIKLRPIREKIRYLMQHDPAGMRAIYVLPTTTCLKKINAMALQPSHTTETKS